MVWACGTHGKLPSSKTSLYGQLKIGERPRHKPKKRFRDCVKGNLKLLEIDVDSWEVLTGYRNEWRKSVKAGCNSLDLKRLEHAEFKRNLRKRPIRGVPGDVNSWECETYDRALFSKAGYVKQFKSHASFQPRVIHASLPPRPQGHICLMCNKVCKSAPGLKRHMVVHKDLIG